MGISIPFPAWKRSVGIGLRRALSHPPRDIAHFPSIVAHSIRYGDVLPDGAQDKLHREGFHQDFPLATVLVFIPKHPVPVFRTLLWLALEAHLQGHRQSLVSALCPTLRGLIRGRSSKLHHTIQECGGLRHLLAKLSLLETNNPELGITGLKDFDLLWRRELKAFSLGLIHRRQQIEEETDPVTPPTHVPDLTPLAMGGGAVEASEPDESPCILLQEILPSEAIPPRALRGALAWSEFISRRSSPDLLRDPDGILLAPLREAIWHKATASARVALLDGRLGDALEATLTMLSIEAGLTYAEAFSTSIGTSTDTIAAAIDLDSMCLRRPEVIPEGSYSPPKEDPRWASIGGDVIFPLSMTTVDLLRELLSKMHGGPDGIPDSMLIPTNSASAEVATEIRSRVRRAISPSHRQYLAARIAGALGLDVAQKAFGDSFGLSAAAMYYGVYPAAAIADAISEINRFTSRADDPRPWETVTKHCLGSRSVPLDPPFQVTWLAVEGSPGRRRGRPSAAAELDEWRRRRNRLALHLLVATGHRPGHAFERLRLHDFVPRYALAYVTDKQTDPAHACRLVCTGQRFVGELEGFVQELERIRIRSDLQRHRELAASILAGRSPIFSLPNLDRAEPLGLSRLLKDLNPLWGERPNLHRHGLAQYLIRQDIDPEQRYWQMGWLCHEHHATSASAPYAPCDLGPRLAPIVDDYLNHCGWGGGCAPKAPERLIPLIPLLDWQARRRDRDQEMGRDFRNLAAQARERHRSTKDEVWQKIKTEVTRNLPGFVASQSSQSPCLDPVAGTAAGSSLRIDRGDIEALLAPFRTADAGPGLLLSATLLLRKALLATASRHKIRVYVPAAPRFDRGLSSSPFLPGAGIATEQVEALLDALLMHAATLKRDITAGEDTDLICMAAILLVCRTPCPSFSAAIQYLNNLDQLRHSGRHLGVARLPSSSGHILLTGDLLVLAGRILRSPSWAAAFDTFRKTPLTLIGQLVQRLCSPLCPQGSPPAGIARLLESTSAIAKILILNGAERLVAESAVVPAVVSAERASGMDEGICIPGAGAPGVSSKLSLALPGGRSPTPPSLRLVAQIMRKFDPDYVGDILGSPAAPPNHRRPQLKTLLEDSLSGAGQQPTAPRLILEYAYHLLTEGGPRSKGGQQISTIWKVFHRLEPILRLAGPSRPLDDFPAEEVTAIVRAACGRSRRKSSLEVLNEFRRFLEVMARRYAISMPDWPVLYRAYGQPVLGGDPAVIADHEAARLIDRLWQWIMELDDADADPAERRWREICLIAALLCEASGARPRSVYGLTLSDLIPGDADYIRLRTSGRYASIKTRTAAGFVPLEGELWEKHRTWFQAWLAGVRQQFPASDQDEVPLFQIPGQPVGGRYELRKVFGVVGELVKWATRQPTARAYWLRKRRVQLRHQRVVARNGARALDMARAMRASGHALMVTPLGNYLGNPVAYHQPTPKGTACARRDCAIALSGLPSASVDRALRASTGNTGAISTMLARLPTPVWPDSPMTDAPVLPIFAGDLMPATVEAIMQDLFNGLDTESIAQRCGVLPRQVQSVEAGLKALSARLHVEIGSTKSVLKPPRGSFEPDPWWDLLVTEQVRLEAVADDWVSVATPASLREGCMLSGTFAASQLKAILELNGVRLTVVERQSDHCTLTLQFYDPRGRKAYGAWPRLRWLLTLAWVCRCRKRLQA